MKKIQTLLLIGIIVGATASGSFINANAALTYPNNVDYAFRNNGNFGSWGYYVDPISYGNPDASAYFTRTIDGNYYNYTTSFQLDLGLTVEMTFNRSNSGWFSTPSGYIPYLTNKIGSDNIVGNITQKVYFEFDNQTTNDYYLYLDHSSTGSNALPWTLKLNNQDIITWQGLGVAYNTGGFMRLYIPSYSNLKFYSSSTSNTVYFDSWYLEDLGVSAAWQAGYGEGESDTLIGLNDGNIFTIIGDAFGAVASVMNIQVLPNLSIGIIFGAWIAILILFNILNVANGTPKSGGKK